MNINSSKAALARIGMMNQARRAATARILNSKSNLQSKNSSASDNKTSSTTTASTQKISKYETMQEAAEDLQKHAKKLLATGEDSLFAKAGAAAQADATEEEKEKLEKQNAKYKEKVIDEIVDFIDNYNIMYKKLQELGGSVNKAYMTQLNQCFTQNKQELSALGITQESAGTLKLDEEILENADISALQKVFQGDKSFTQAVYGMSEKIEANAESNISVLDKLYGTQSYNSKGNSYSNYTSSSWYNAQG